MHEAFMKLNFTKIEYFENDSREDILKRVEE